jgi:hypothetical protein
VVLLHLVPVHHRLPPPLGRWPEVCGRAVRPVAVIHSRPTCTSSTGHPVSHRRDTTRPAKGLRSVLRNRTVEVRGAPGISFHIKHLNIFPHPSPFGLSLHALPDPPGLPAATDADTDDLGIPRRDLSAWRIRGRSMGQDRKSGTCSPRGSCRLPWGNVRENIPPIGGKCRTLGHKRFH